MALTSGGRDLDTCLLGWGAEGHRAVKYDCQVEGKNNTDSVLPVLPQERLGPPLPRVTWWGHALFAGEILTHLSTYMSDGYSLTRHPRKLKIRRQELNCQRELTRTLIKGSFENTEFNNDDRRMIERQVTIFVIE